MHPNRPAPLINNVAMYLSLEVQRGLVRFPESNRIPASCEEKKTHQKSLIFLKQERDYISKSTKLHKEESEKNQNKSEKDKRLQQRNENRIWSKIFREKTLGGGM